MVEWGLTPLDARCRPPRRTRRSFSASTRDRRHRAGEGGDWSVRGRAARRRLAAGDSEGRPEARRGRRGNPAVTDARRRRGAAGPGRGLHGRTPVGGSPRRRPPGPAPAFRPRRLAHVRPTDGRARGGGYRPIRFDFRGFGRSERPTEPYSRRRRRGSPRRDGGRAGGGGRMLARRRRRPRAGDRARQPCERPGPGRLRDPGLPGLVAPHARDLGRGRRGREERRHRSRPRARHVALGADARRALRRPHPRDRPRQRRRADDPRGARDLAGGTARAPPRRDRRSHARDGRRPRHPRDAGHSADMLAERIPDARGPSSSRAPTISFRPAARRSSTGRCSSSSTTSSVRSFAKRSGNGACSVRNDMAGGIGVGVHRPGGRPRPRLPRSPRGSRSPGPTRSGRPTTGCTWRRSACGIPRRFPSRPPGSSEPRGELRRVRRSSPGSPG